VVPSLVGGVQGCAFRSRCTIARGICADAIPVRQASATHRYICVADAAQERAA
jgi:peptide/nickel transport system ATP-binding protein